MIGENIEFYEGMTREICLSSLGMTQLCHIPGVLSKINKNAIENLDSPCTVTPNMHLKMSL